MADEGARKCGSIRKGRGSQGQKKQGKTTTRQEGEIQVLLIFDFDFEIGSTCYGTC